METPFAMMKRQLAATDQAGSPFANLSDRALVMALSAMLLSVPRDRVKAIIERKSQSESVKDRYEARELALVLFVHEELSKMPEGVPFAEGMLIMRETLKEMLVEGMPFKPR